MVKQQKSQIKKNDFIYYKFKNIFWNIYSYNIEKYLCILWEYIFFRCHSKIIYRLYISKNHLQLFWLTSDKTNSSWLIVEEDARKFKFMPISMGPILVSSQCFPIFLFSFFIAWSVFIIILVKMICLSKMMRFCLGLYLHITRMRLQ